MDKTVVTLASDILKSPVKIQQRLMGGRSNYTYVISDNEQLYTFRIPGKNAEFFVDREIEKNNVDVVHQLGLNNETIYFDVDTGHKVAYYIEGTILSEINYLSEVILQEVADNLIFLHSSSLFKNDYKPFERLKKYESYCIDLNHVHSEKYQQLKNKLLTYSDFLLDANLVPCHCDFQCSNIIKGQDKIYFTDWEYSGNNDPFYDIACFCDPKLENGERLLEFYLKRKPTLDELNRVYLWRAFQALQWHNVAMFKELVGLSNDLQIDFAYFAKKYLDLAQLLLKKVEEK